MRDLRNGMAQEEAPRPFTGLSNWVSANTSAIVANATNADEYIRSRAGERLIHSRSGAEYNYIISEDSVAQAPEASPQSEPRELVVE